MTSPHGDTSPVFDLRSASFGYAGRTVVSGVDLTVMPGDRIAVLGPNGGGKSTLVKGLLRINDHTGGQVHVFGKPLAKFRQHGRLGYVPQRHSLSTSVRATVREIVTVGRLRKMGLLGLPRRADRRVIDQALDYVGLLGEARTDVATLSGGQQRRVLIARALAGEPDVLLMDEPTAGVDAANQAQLAEVLRQLAQDGTTMMIVTHELSALTGIVTRMVEIADGGLALDGSPQDWLDRQACMLGTDHHHGHSPDPGEPSTRHMPDGPLDPARVHENPYGGTA